MNLLGFSAGTAEAIFALEELPETAQVDHVALLGTSISRAYDLTEALKRVRNKLYIFTSTHDQMLGTLMPFSGTADRKFHDPGAGIKGFVLPAGASAATRRLYANKIVTIPYAEDFRKDKNQGHHFDNVKKEFIRDHVAPLLMGQRVSERDRSPTGSSLSSGRAAALHLHKTLAQDAQGCTQDACAPHPRPTPVFCYLTPSKPSWRADEGHRT